MLRKSLYFFIIFLWSILFLNAQNEFDGHKAYIYLKKQVDFGPRVPGSPAHEQCSKYFIQFFKKLGYKVMEQPFYHFDQRKNKTISMKNIIVRIDPDNKNRIMLCAHWDSRPTADMEKGKNKSLPIPGANDGASGVAVLMHLAELFKNTPPPIGIDIVLFDGEDYGPQGHLDEYFLGSRYFVEHNPEIYPRLAILLDMVGDKNLNIKMEGYSVYYAGNWVELIWRKAQELGYYQFEYERGPYIEDDHVILNQAGIPAVDIIDFEYPDSKNSYWHTLKDIPENCSPESLEIVGDVLFRLIMDTNWMRY